MYHVIINLSLYLPPLINCNSLMPQNQSFSYFTPSSQQVPGNHQPLNKCLLIKLNKNMEVGFNSSNSY